VAGLVGFLLFLVFAQDNGAAYRVHLVAPLAWAYDVLLAPLPIKVRPFDLIMLTLLVLASFRGSKRGETVLPMRRALFLMLVTTATWVVYGLTHGGDFRFASWQTYLILSSVLTAFTIAATFRTVDDFARLGYWILASAFYRALFCWISYFTWGKLEAGETGAFLTTHDDTIGWVVGILILLIHSFTKKSTAVRLRNAVGILFLLGAIQFNSRRLAWVSLATGLIAMYVLFPHGAVKKRLNRLAWVLAPLVIVYVLVGWGRPEHIFFPLRSLLSVSSQEDSSTLARNAENLGLIYTANSNSPFFGTGWGRPYIFLTMKYDISASFELWKYIPHNSILGLLAFTGALGFAGFWLAMPTAVFLLIRVARLASDPRAKSVAIVGVAQMIVCANQLYGDMGIFFVQPMYVMAVSYAMALRLPRMTGVWNKPKAS
jgi:hypothetical protein